MFDIQIGKYQLVSLVGRGGMAEVYEAIQPGTERSVAIKILQGTGHQSPTLIDRFKREARSVAQLRHPHIIQLFDFDVDKDLYYMVMEFVRGGTLYEHIKGHGKLSPKEAISLMIPLVDALAYAHKHGVIHRDIKPDNIMFLDHAHTHPVITDFGIARIAIDPALTADGRLVGSPAYLSPEVAMGATADERSDIYGLGLTFYEMLAGRMPFYAENTDAFLIQHRSVPAPRVIQFNAEVYPALEKVLMRALAKDRDQRYQTADSFKADLEELLHNASASTSEKKLSPVLTPILTDSQPNSTRDLRMTDLRFGIDEESKEFDEVLLEESNAEAVQNAPVTVRQTKYGWRGSRVFIGVFVAAILTGVTGYMALGHQWAQATTLATPTTEQAQVITNSETEIPATATQVFTATWTPTAVEPTATFTVVPTQTFAPLSTLVPTYTPEVTNSNTAMLAGQRRPAHQSASGEATTVYINVPATTQPITGNNNGQQQQQQVNTNSGGQTVQSTAVPNNPPVVNPTSVPNNPVPTTVPPTSVPPTNPPPAAPTTAPSIGQTVGQVVDQVVQPVQNIVQEVLPCVLNCP